MFIIINFIPHERVSRTREGCPAQGAPSADTMAQGAQSRGKSVVRWRWRHAQSLTAVWFTGGHISAGELKAIIRRSRGFGHVYRKGAADLVVLDEQTNQGK